jgi:zinc transport system substrate-binding protein
MVYHPAWSYFARDYDLVQIPIESDGKDPSPTGIENLIQQAKEGNITVVFASPEYSTKSAEVIAKEIGGSVTMVSPLEEDYLGNIRNVSHAFIRGGQ